MTYVKRKWVPTDSHPGASDLNRIEDGIESAHQKIAEINIQPAEPKVLTSNAEDLIERVKLLPKLDDKAKTADIIKAYNALIDAVSGIATVDHSDNQDNVDNQEQKEGE